jgi:hypothetical protein
VTQTQEQAVTRPDRPIDLGLAFVDSVYRQTLAWLFEDKRALRGVALARILSGLSVLGIFATNFRVRGILFGQGSVWNKEAYEESSFTNSPFGPPRIVENMGNSTFTVYYLVVLLLAVLFILGWHTRFVGPLMLIGEISLTERIPILGDQGDNILRVGLFLLMFMHTSEYWSLDARRRERTSRIALAPREPLGNAWATMRNLWNSQFVLPRWLSNSLHNVALATLGFQLITIYIWAAVYKITGELWQHGTAIYYPMQLHEYKPFPFLSDLMTHFGVMVGLATYVVIFTQMFFALMLLHVVTRRIAIVLVITFHVSIAILMALPWFSLTLIAFDAIWVSTSTLAALDRWLRRMLRPVATLFWDVVDPVADRLPWRRAS